MGDVTSKTGSDPVVMVVLDKLLEFTSIDPSSIFPDDQLGADLGMAQAEIERLLVASAQALGLEIASVPELIAEATPRHLVACLKEWDSSRGQLAG